MLDPLPINQKETRELKCEICGALFRNDIDCEEGDYNSIDETGRCEDCFEEWGGNYPDRV